MGKFVDLTGQRFGRLTVIKRAPNKGRRTVWLCECDCGTEKEIRQEDLRSNKTVSCGCYLHERITKHGMSEESIYRTWASMKDRCLNANGASYERYGAKNRTVCEKWREFEPFYEYVSKLPHFGEDGYTLNRINNNGNYEPGNVEWATDIQQMNNMSANHLLEYRGSVHTVTEWARIKGLPIECFRNRISRGWSVEKALETPVKTKTSKRCVLYDGEEYSVAELSKVLNIPRTTLNNKINSGMSINEILSKKNTP